MCMKTFNANDINEGNYNFVVSNVILSQKEAFTYDDIICKLSNMFEELTEKICSVVKRCLLRLREDGFLSVLGSNYSVVNISL